jgi:hypothetical protein
MQEMQRKNLLKSISFRFHNLFRKECKVVVLKHSEIFVFNLVQCHWLRVLQYCTCA